MSVLDGPGEGTWSVFAMKVVEERDELRYKLAGDAAYIKSLEGLLVDAVRERDELKARSYTFRGGYIEDAAGDRWWSADLLARVERERDRAQAQLENVLDASKEGAWMARALDAERERDLIKNHYSAETAAKLRAELASARAEVEMLRGVGCRETKEGEPESGPCGVCLRCVEERGERRAQAAVIDAALIHAKLIEERDEARAELQKTRDDFSSVWDSRDEVIKERDRAQQACNAYWHDLMRIAFLCEQTADEYPLKAVERTVREFRESRRDFVRVADALGLVGTDDTGRVGAIASVEDIVTQARHAARALSHVAPESE